MCYTLNQETGEVGKGELRKPIIKIQCTPRKPHAGDYYVNTERDEENWPLTQVWLYSWKYFQKGKNMHCWVVIGCVGQTEADKGPCAEFQGLQSTWHTQGVRSRSKSPRHNVLRIPESSNLGLPATRTERAGYHVNAPNICFNEKILLPSHIRIYYLFGVFIRKTILTF